jgi:acyl-CoA thioester hydrolase
MGGAVSRPQEDHDVSEGLGAMPDSDTITIRVRYAETDRMGLLHHANYLVYFETGRTELLRKRGFAYRDIEDAGHFLVIVEVGCKFKRPAHYDDLLTLTTVVERVTHVKIVHRYEIQRDGLLLAEGHSTLACVDRDGRPQPLPPMLRKDQGGSHPAGTARV